jgi:hypothetical protein
MHNQWSMVDEAFLEQNYGKLPIDVICVRLNRTFRAVTVKAHNLDLTKATKPWTNQEIRYLREWYKKLPIREICESMERTKGSVRKKAQYMNLMIPRGEKHEFA